MPYTYDYPRPMVTVDIAVFYLTKKDLNILLVKRKNDPFKDCWALPGGFLDMEETLEEAALRELEEETGLKGVELEQHCAFDAVDRDPRGRTITVLYFGMTAPDNIEVKGNDDAADAQWFPLTKLPKLAFDHEMILEILEDAIPDERIIEFIAKTED